MLTSEAQQEVLAIARAAMEAAVRGEDYSPPEPSADQLREPGACFVTLRTREQLRGCLGCFESDEPLYKTVADFAMHSTLEDPRFASNRVSAEELGFVTLEISVLHPLTPCTDPLGITLGDDGIFVRGGWRSGVYLPHVAIEMNWSVEEFWSNCCAGKAGLSPEAWRGGDVELFTFKAELLTDPAPGENRADA